MVPSEPSEQTLPRPLSFALALATKGRGGGPLMVIMAHVSNFPSSSTLDKAEQASVCVTLTKSELPTGFIQGLATEHPWECS